jgi:hypothetical protein
MVGGVLKSYYMPKIPVEEVQNKESFSNTLPNLFRYFNQRFIE